MAGAYARPRALEPFDQVGARAERFEVWRFVLGDAGEDLDLGAPEGVGDERRERPGRQWKLQVVLGGPVFGDLREHRPPARHRVPPASGEDLAEWRTACEYGDFQIAHFRDNIADIAGPGCHLSRA
jgi:hypothetical protein